MAKNILSGSGRKKAVVLGLVGDLGGGKTAFLQGFAKGLGIKEKILSPTFIIIRRINNFYHIDCYRLKKSKEIFSLGFKEIISNPKNIVAIEWADRIQRVLPKNTIMLRFEFAGKNARKITISTLKRRQNGVQEKIQSDGWPFDSRPGISVLRHGQSGKRRCPSS